MDDKNHFGKLGIITLNAHVERDTLEQNQQEEILNLIDTHHPSILALQGVGKSELKSIEQRLKGHYEAACRKALFRELWMNRLEVLPILYDTNTLMRISEIVFEPTEYENQAYGCAVVFYDRTINMMYTVVNVDLPSTNKGLVDSQIFNIFQNIKKSKFKTFPIFLTGTINEMSDSLEILVTKGLNNLVEFDKNNVGLSRTTFHHYGRVGDNQQRDFVLLEDGDKRLKLNYARILSRFPKRNFEHFPVYAILSDNR